MLLEHLLSKSFHMISDYTLHFMNLTHSDPLYLRSESRTLISIIQPNIINAEGIQILALSVSNQLMSASKISECMTELKLTMGQLSHCISQLNFTVPMLRSFGEMETQMRLICKVAEESVRESQPSSDSEKWKKIKRGPYRSYSTELKQKVIDLHLSGDNYNTISRKMKIPPKNIVRWCKGGCYRKSGAGRKVFDPQMEQQLMQWIHSNYNNGDCISPSLVRTNAKKFSNNKLFAASLGWLKNFIRRNHLDDSYQFKQLN